MAAVALASPAMANNPVFGPDSVDILGDGIFESQGSSFRFPAETDTNIDTLVVGNDIVRTFGSSDFFAKKTIATNNLEIKKNQDSGDCSPCDSCGDNCIKVNTEMPG